MNKRNLNYSQIKSIVLLGVSMDLEEDIDAAKRYVLKLAEELYRRSEKASDKVKQCQN